MMAHIQRVRVTMQAHDRRFHTFFERTFNSQVNALMQRKEAMFHRKTLVVACFYTILGLTCNHKKRQLTMIMQQLPQQPQHQQRLAKEIRMFRKMFHAIKQTVTQEALRQVCDAI